MKSQMKATTCKEELLYDECEEGPGKKMNWCHGSVYVSTSESLVLVLGFWSVCYFISQLPFWFCLSYVVASP